MNRIFMNGIFILGFKNNSLKIEKLLGVKLPKLIFALRF